MWVVSYGLRMNRVHKPDLQAEWWSAKDIADYLGLAIDTVTSYRSRGQMPSEDAVILGKRAWHPATIIEWNDKRPGRGGRPSKNQQEA